MAKKSQPRVVLGNQPKVEQLLPSTELLAYYKARLGELINQPTLRACAPFSLLHCSRHCAHITVCADDFDQERQGLIEALERCAVQQADVHQLEWENRKRAEEIRDLQKV